MKKQRLDTLLTETGHFETRSKAQSAIMAGLILVDNIKIAKPGTAVSKEATIRVLGDVLPYVSRGGLKLAKALSCFDFSVNNKVVADIGASTGGFTDCALQNGAQRVYAIDVGYGQLAWKLRTDERVICMERTNVRYLTSESLPEQIDRITIDVAFISLDKVLPVLKNILKPDGEVLALIKPQFEAGKANIGKKGVVRDAAVHLAVIEKVIDCAEQEGFKIAGLNYSPIKGPEGNIEYLLYLTLKGESTLTLDSVKPIVKQAQETLNVKEVGETR
ncbi:MAG TPA: TlyA family RNA methyltransferase [Candidatus Avacidaminococcus intestinavium]|uniref:TlyA family RNA methyltransferase n=1 Tax=Candidatus Avacidaminococcus intestinavium TaxID=2840684 RepID=A0A9D1SKJ0_9FIRM|nr:TlyA family RNA methyltransferase [Candidatus Avacidaminococcus intestinavium]